jgi:RHS repeat-associated protein
MIRALNRAALATCVCWIVMGWASTATAQTVPWDPNAPAPVNQPPISPLGASAQMSPQVPSGVAVGRTKGSFSVSSAGDATYSIPLWTPQGIAGLQPSLALTYSSSRGDGLYGVGWGISGLPAISRCNKTYAQDGIGAAVFLTSADLYCLNGNKLRSFGGTTYGADGAQYQTELADFSLVISHGTAGTGPAWFEVHGKNGLIYQYGNTSDSALLATGTTSVLVWALNRITDRFGNHIDFAYTNDTTYQVLRPLTITYTTPPSGVSGVQTTANYQVQFSYVSRSGTVPTGFIVGAQFMEPYLAQTITIAAWNGSGYAAVRTYNFTYNTGAATTRSRLQSVQECSPTQCFSPTNITYQNGSTGWASAITSSGNLQNFGPGTGFAGDLNGDGFQDIVYPDPTSGHWYYLLGSASGSLSGPYDTGVASTTAIYGIDYKGDGKTDLLLRNGSGNWRVMFYQSPGGAFAITDTPSPAPNLPAGHTNLIIGDVDGDGREDVIYVVSGGSSWYTNDVLYYQRNTGSGFGTAQQIFATNNVQGSGSYQKLGDFNIAGWSSHIRRPDFNGDGRTDFFLWLNTCGDSDTHCQNGGGLRRNYNQLWASNSTGVGYTVRGSYSGSLLIGDFNGDGCADIAYGFAGSYWTLQYGTCDRSGASTILSAAVTTTSVWYNASIAIDWDGDGMDDIVAPNGTWGYAHSTGTNLGPWTSLGIAYNGYGQPIPVDVTGDGQYDILFPAQSTYKPTVLPHNGGGVKADLATSFTDGFGFSYSPTYTQLTNSTYYSEGSGAAYPEEDYKGPLTVVASYTVADASTTGGTYAVSEFYNAARVNVQGRGFEGFGYIRALDSRNSLYKYDYYSQLFPNTGMVSQVTLSTSSKTYANVTNTNTYATLDSTYKRYFPYTSTSVKSLYEFGGGLDGTLITQATTTVTYGGSNGFTYGNPSQIVTTTVDKDPNSPWPSATFTDTVNITPYEVGGTSSTGWCIHLSGQVSEQRTQPGGANLTHTTSYGVNVNSECEVDSKTVEPSSTVDKLVTAYGYDGCGNVNSVGLTGQIPSGNNTPASRTTGVSYGSHCIYPETVTNALSQSSSMGYRYDLGLPASSTDPNNLTTSWTYNDIGQKTFEQRPDGTQTSYSFTACSNHCGSTAPLQYVLYTYEQDSTSSHTTFRQHADYYDQLDRLILDQVQSTGGQWVSTETDFDNLGRLKDRSSPTTGSTTTAYYTTASYDLLDRVTSVSRPISSTNSTLEYTNYGYQGRKATIQDPKGYTTTRQIDVIGELGIVTDPDGVSKTTYGYDPFSNLTSITDPANNPTTRTFDTLGYLLTASSDSDRGSWTFQYDSFGELSNLRDAKTSAPSWTQQLTYDALGRTIQRVETEGTTTWTWGTSAANHEIGQLKQVSGPGDTDSFTYDSAGRPASRSMFNGITYTVSYSYNNIGKLGVLTYPLAAGQANPFAVLYSYSNGYLSSLQNYTGGVASTTFWQLTPAVNGIDAWGHVIDETLGTTTAVRIQSAFDGVTGWINTRTVGSGGSLNNLQNRAYQWDLNGNLSERQAITAGLTEAFNYDNLNRLQTSTLNGTQNLSVSIDNTGNITQRIEGGITYPYTYDTTHKHAVDTVGTSPNETTYTYDSNGNMATRNALSMTWASYNLPTAINGSGGVSSTFTYGPDRRVIQQAATYVADGDSGTETNTYVFGLYEYEMTPAQNHNKYFIQVPGGTHIIYDLQSVSGAQTTYITADHLGSGSLFLNSSGTAEITESYSAYGYRRSSNWSGPLSSTSSDYTTIASTTRRGYTDAFHEVLDNLNLIHMNGRVYAPAIGRFLSPDPIVTEVGNSQSINPYSYVQNRPLAMTDPTGLENVPLAQCKDGGGGTGGGCSGISESRDILWDFASFGQETQCYGKCGDTRVNTNSGTSAGKGSNSSASASDPAAAVANPAISAGNDSALADSSAQGSQQPLQEVVVNGIQEVVVNGNRPEGAGPGPAPPLLAQEFFFGSAQEYQSALEAWARTGMRGPRPPQPLTPGQQVPAPGTPPVTSPVNPVPQTPTSPGWWLWWSGWILQRIFGAGSAPPVSPVAPPSVCYNNPNCA